jgi:hypothetical protein
MPGNVCHQDAQMVVVCPDKFVKIARDSRYGMLRSDNTEALKLGNAGGKN